MSRATRLGNHIERTVTGPMWHGPALLEVLDGVDAARARAHPIAGAHSIWEIVKHVTAWAEIARQRIHGEALGDPTAEQDWPAIGDNRTVSAVSDTTSDPTSDTTSDPTSDTTSDPTSDPESEWRRAVERLKESHRRLAADVRQLDDAALDARVKTLDYPVGILLDGVVEHGTYHGGQIALLKKA